MMAVTAVVTPSTASARGRLQKHARTRLGRVRGPMTAQVETRRRRCTAPSRKGDGDGHRGRANAGLDRRDSRLSPRHDERERPQTPTSPSAPASDRRSGAPRPDEHREAEHEQEVRDDAAGERSADDVRQPAATAMRAMISSGAFPNLALRKPPIPGPVCSPACSVNSPINQARGTSATAASDELDDGRRRVDLVERQRRAGASTSPAPESFAPPTDPNRPAAATYPSRPEMSSLAEHCICHCHHSGADRARSTPSRGRQSNYRCGRRTRSSAIAARSIATRLCTRAPASSAPARSSTRTRRGGHTYMGCMQRVFTVEIDLELLPAVPSSGGTGSAGSGRGGRRCRCAASRSRLATRVARTRSAAATRSSSRSRASARASASSRRFAASAAPDRSRDTS